MEEKSRKQMNTVVKNATRKKSMSLHKIGEKQVRTAKKSIKLIQTNGRSHDNVKLGLWQQDWNKKRETSKKLN